jgi:hypothetical protein
MSSLRGLIFDDLIWAILDTPLVMPNEIKFGCWEAVLWRWSGFLASMPINYYGHTNFPSS